MMAEEGTRPSRTTTESPDQTAPGMTDQTARDREERHSQPRQYRAMPASDGVAEELSKTQPALYKRPLLLAELEHRYRQTTDF